MKKTGKKTGTLRKRAEDMLAKQKERLQKLSATDLKKLVHELGTHQIELEMQNEELRRAQEELESSRARYADLYDFSPVGYFTFNTNGLIKEVNLTGAGMLGSTKRLLLNKPVLPYIDPAHRTIFRDHLLEAARTQARESCEIAVRKKDGTTFHAQLHSIFFPSQEGPGVCRTTVSDVTGRKRAEETRKRAKDLSDALNRINKAVHSTFDFDEIMRRVIREAGEAVGCDSAAISLREGGRWVIQYAYGFPQEVVGSHLPDQEQPHAVLALNLLKPVVIADAYHDARLNVAHMKKLGIRSVLVIPLVAGEKHLGAIFFNHHTPAVSFSTEEIDFADKLASTITLAMENARLFEERQRARQELEAMNVELEAFSYSVSHDLRAPLRSIEGFTKALLEDHASAFDATAKDYFNRVIAASRRMDQLIEAMLNMARLTKDELRVQTVDLSGLVEVVAYELRKTDPSRKVEFVIAGKVKARGDTDMLRMVVENLMDNAWKFTSKRPSAKIEFGVFEREMGNGEGGAKDVSSGSDSAIRNPQSEIVYFIRDDGAGFDMTFADKLFKPFQRLHKETEFPGIGIGLATVKRIVERHGGKIWAESEIGKGTTVFFTL